MAKDDIDLLEPNEIAFRLELTPPELKLTYSALLNDFGHDEYDVQRIIRLVLNKLPPPESIESIDLRRAGTGDRRLGRDLHHPDAAR
jgi:hypothetical protein